MSRRLSVASQGGLVRGANRRISAAAGSRIVQLAVIFTLCLAVPAGAVVGPSVAKVEEDWEIIVDDPSPDEVLPQLYVVTSPTGNITGQYSVFEINNLLLPDFYGGGLQFQTWSGEQATGEAHHSNFNAFSTAGETITFTVSMRLSSFGDMIFKVKNGQSTTWGAFGENNSLRISESSTVSDLSGYDPEQSARLSRVGSGRNRVTAFRIKQIRYYDVYNNLLATDSTVRDAQIDEPE
jgi:hypothetical protein